MAHGLNPQQAAAVRKIEGPLLVLAGAGTGKTRVITHRIAQMLSQGIEPKHILALTFTNKAAREMQERVRSLLSRFDRGKNRKSKLRRPTICTFHSLGVRILRRHIEALGYKRNFIIYDESDQLAVIRKIISRFQSRNEKSDFANILFLLSQYRNSRKSDDHNFSEKSNADLNEIQKQYVSALKACNAVDFDDLILLPIRLFHKCPEVLDACQKRYRYVMVDEYQDTNARQFELVHLLTKMHRNLCVVGDDDQSIYGWRGAEIANLFNLEKDYPELKTISLEQNYRSTNVILKAANALIKHNSQRKPKSLWSEKGEGKLIELASYSDDEDEARSVVEEIEFRRVARKIPWSSQAILFRTNHQSRILETSLRNAKVRYQLVGGHSFFDRREIKDCIAYMKLAINPSDDNSLLRIANVPSRGISEKSAQRLIFLSQERGASIFEIISSASLSGFSSAAKRGFEDLKKVINHSHNQLLQDHIRLSDWAYEMLDQSQYLKHLNDLKDNQKNEKNLKMINSRICNVKEFVEGMDRNQTNQLPEKRLQRFLDSLIIEERRTRDEVDQVTLITAHSCKGLEFPHVFLVGVEEGLIPHSRSRLEGNVEEERRLFYVAITRAMQSLCMSFCNVRKKYGEKIPCHPSSFLDEIPKALINQLDETSLQAVEHETGRGYFSAIKDSLS